MECFGRPRSEVVMGWPLLLATTLCLLLRPAYTTMIHTRVQSINSQGLPGGEVAIHNSHFYSLTGRSIRIDCICRNPETATVDMVELTLKGTHLRILSGCESLRHTISDISHQNEGRYECILRFTNGSTVMKEVGSLHVIDARTIHVPQVQFGLLNDSVTLNCSTSLNRSVTVVTTTWMNSSRSTIPNGRINSVQLSHEGQYTCELYLSTLNLVVEKVTQFIVIVPPRITSKPPERLNFSTNTQQNFTVNFLSKNCNETVISWYKDSYALQDNAHRRYNCYNGSINSRTEVILNPIRRSDKGEYHLVIENTHNIIPTSNRTTEARFIVDVRILPTTPTGLYAHSITDRSVNLTWSLPNLIFDNTPDNLTVVVRYTYNNSMTQRIQLESGTREVQLSLVPGMSYNAEVVAQNQDGTVVSQPFPFNTLNGAPSVSEVILRRSMNRNNTLHLQVTLAYTGGGNITHFVISFRKIGTVQWSLLPMNFIAVAVGQSMLVWTTDVVDEQFQYSNVELQFQVVNFHRIRSSVIEQREEIVLPGEPTDVKVVSFDYESVVITLKLPRVGTPPFTHLEVQFSRPEIYVQNITGIGLNVGNVVIIKLSDLQEGTVYLISVSVYNFGGKGMSSQQIQVTTMSRPLLPTHGIVVVSACGCLLLAVAVAVIVVIVMSWKKSKRKERAYSVSGAESNHLPSENPIVKGGKLSPISPIPPTPPTPSTATSVLSPRTSPPGFPPTPPYSSSTSCLPSSSLSTGLPTGLMSGPFHSSFKFDAGSSRSNSVNQDSDFSESNSPGYTYTLPRSGEGTPSIMRAHDPMDQRTSRIGRGYDQVDLHHDQMTFNDSRVERNGVGYDSGIFPGPRGRLRSDGAPGYIMVDSPQQSMHSVNTTVTRLTSSDSVSTRDSLLFPRIETNTTDV